SFTSACNCLTSAVTWQARRSPPTASGGPDMPTATAPQIPSFEAIVKPAKDVFYVTVGLGVMAFEQLKSSQADVWSWFESQVADGRAQFETQATQIEERFEALMQNVQDKLPEQAADLMKQARDAAKSARDQINDFVNRGSQNAAA